MTSVAKEVKKSLNEYAEQKDYFPTEFYLITEEIDDEQFVDWLYDIAEEVAEEQHLTYTDKYRQLLAGILYKLYDDQFVPQQYRH